MLPSLKTRAKAKARKKAKRKAARSCRTVTRKVHGKKRRVKVCTPKAAAQKPSVVAPVRPILAPATPPAPSAAPVPTFTKPASEAHVERLLWRAGFGPAPGQAA